MEGQPPKPVITEAEILVHLNGPTGKGPWVRGAGYFAISSPEIDDKGNLNFLAPKEGVVLILFINTETGEIKSFIAKYTDDPIRNKLWQS